MRKIINLQPQSSFTLLEAIAALAVMGAAVMGVYSLTEQSVKDTRGSITATHLKTIGDAANEYIRMNYAAVTANATATTPALIRVSDFQLNPFLLLFCLSLNFPLCDLSMNVSDIRLLRHGLRKAKNFWLRMMYRHAAVLNWSQLYWKQGEWHGGRLATAFSIIAPTALQA